MIVRSGVADSCLVGDHRKKQPETELLYVVRGLNDNSV